MLAVGTVEGAASALNDSKDCLSAFDAGLAIAAIDGDAETFAVGEGAGLSVFGISGDNGVTKYFLDCRVESL